MIKKGKKKLQILLSVIVIAKNEEKKLPECLESVKWADEIVLIDTGSIDATKEIAKKYGTKTFDYKGGSYQDWRNEGLKKAGGKWVLYIDADERVTEELKERILFHLKNYRLHNEEGEPVAEGYAIARKNIILGKEFKHGGQYPDYQKRLFKRSKLKGWSGDLHEEPIFEEYMGHIREPLLHIKHDNLSEMVEKTNKWSVLEAKMLYATGHPKMVWWRFIRIMMTELWIRLIKQGGVLDGVEGIIYGIYQSWSRFITYGKLWEMQLREDNKNVILERNAMKRYP